ncbi:PREDICTED: uncharacterized protein LOC104798573 [Tarenaya hassleriana]|uniref:uncharacterized protein LOC104798573 n=1 Tax=Tarenaya hassleriana TaxID=28532 RepID=UPI00053C9FF0|nr:PREDICTED: uncharacterized protein LOC104798573 [Tarenaya hassleriana]
MSSPAIISFEDHLTQKPNDVERQGFRVFPSENFRVYPGENPNPNHNFLVKQAILQSEKSVGPIFSSRRSSSAKDESFRLVLPPAMPPPRDSAVPLPILPESMRPRKKLTHHESMVSLRKSRYSEKILYEEENFKCSPFCVTLPGFGKHKLVKSSKREDSMEKKMIRASSFTNSTTISNRASMEKFECGSWASTTALVVDHGRFFDLPVEMTKSGGDVQNPVTSGFLFERESTDHQVLRGVLKTSGSLSRHPRRSPETPETSPPRRVRFSTSVSCPTSPRSCITPRLRKARDDFNAFLAAAQNV